VEEWMSAGKPSAASQAAARKLYSLLFVSFFSWRVFFSFSLFFGGELLW
jgi:hypothetical protein